MEPCNKGPDIDKLNSKVDHLADLHKANSSDLKQAINRLTAIIEADIETRAAVEQLKKDREVLYAKYHGIDARVDGIETLAHQYKGAKIYDRVPVLWDWRQQEMGWRRFLPAMLAGLSFLILLYNTFNANFTVPHTHIPRGDVVEDYGVVPQTRH